LADKDILGKNKGCDFINKKCNASEDYTEFCYTQNSVGCSYQREGVGDCFYDPFSNFCNYYQVDDQYDCHNELNSNYWDTSESK